MADELEQWISVQKEIIQLHQSLTDKKCECIDREIEARYAALFDFGYRMGKVRELSQSIDQVLEKQDIISNILPQINHSSVIDCKQKGIIDFGKETLECNAEIELSEISKKMTFISEQLEKMKKLIN